ncbi:MAG TPA: DUF4126 domain-containing protein [Fimbriimonadaceae bacterium]|nr:DUF4126 domain-containing protein [Fimbriimonadaceae bacterium]
MDFLQTLGLAAGAAWLSGIRLYALVSILGLLARFGSLHLPQSLSILESPWVIGVSSALFLIEFVADKVPAIDSAWDAVHTFIRIPAGAVLAAGAFGDYDPVVKVVAGLLGGSLAFGSHATKATTRAAVNTSPEPVSNFVVSTAEDVYAIGSTFAAAFAPVLILIIVGIGVLIAIFMLPRLIRLAKRLFRRDPGKSPIPPQSKG